MSSVAEILITSREAYIKTFNEAKQALENFGKSGEDVGKKLDTVNRKAEAVVKLMDRGFDPKQAVKVAEAWQHAADKADVYRQTFEVAGASTQKTAQAAQLAAAGLARELGIVMPEAVTRFLSRTQTVGPILAGAFSTVAVIGMIQAVGQLPALFDRLRGAVTGWDETAKKAYADQIELNRKYIDVLKEARDVQIDLMQRRGQITAADAVGLRAEDIRAEIKRLSDTERTTQDEILFRKGPSPAERDRERLRIQLGGKPGGVRQATPESDAELSERLRNTTAEIEKLNIQLRQLETVKLPAAKFEDEEAAKRKAKERADEQKRLDEVKWGIGGEVIALRADRALQQTAGAGMSRADWSWLSNLRAAQMPVLPPAPNLAMVPTPDVLLRLMESRNTAELAIVAENFKKYEELREATQKFIDSINEGLGRTWDVFTMRGVSAMEKLTRLGSMFFDTLGRQLFQNLGTAIMTGRTPGFAGGFPGMTTMASGGGLLSKVPGLGSFSNQGGLLGLASKLPVVGGLFGATAAPAMMSAVPAGMLPFGVLAPSAIAAPSLAGGAAAGAAAAGGSTILGMSLATAVPVFGAIAAGAIFGLSKLFGHRTIEAPFTRDPLEGERSRTIFFFTGMAEAMNRFSDSIDGFTKTVRIMQPGDVVTIGMPQAIEGSNQFRRTIAGNLLDEDL